MSTRKIKDIFHFQKEEMSRTVKWGFGLPFAYTVYILLSMLIPVFGTSSVAVLSKNILMESALLFSFFLIIRRFLKVDKIRIFTDKDSFSFQKLFTGFLTMFVSGLVLMFLQMVFNPEAFEFSLRGNPLVEWIFTLIFIVIAAMTEEVIFRFYIGHFLSDKFPSSAKSKIICCLISGVFFALAHLGNPEVKSAMFISMGFYLLFGIALMACTLITGGIEFSLGMHIANNLIVGWFFSYKNSVIKTNTLFSQTCEIDYHTIIQIAVCSVICCFVSQKLSQKLSCSKH